MKMKYILIKDAPLATQEQDRIVIPKGTKLISDKYVNEDDGIECEVVNGKYKGMKKFVCIAKCPELDCDNLCHCTDTKEGIQRREEKRQDYCACGNEAIWEEIIEE